MKTRKSDTLLLAVAACATAIAPLSWAKDAPAGPSAVRAAFGNTIRSTYPDGRTAELWLSANGAYTAEGRRHDPSSGHWNLKGGKLCLKQAHPMAVPFSYCVPLPAAGMAAGWTGKAYTGEPIKIRLIHGHVSGGG